MKSGQSLQEKISKICWNDFHWAKPSGTNGKSPSANSYENARGFGHEEWLLDKSKVIDGYHYGFLQPLNLKTDRHVGKSYKIWLYSIRADEKVLIGCIEKAICISKEESKEVYKEYTKKGWIKEMISDLEDAGINSTAFKETDPLIFVNVKFAIKDIKRSDEYHIIEKNDKNITTTRYKLLDKVADFKFVKPKHKGTEGFRRKKVEETFVDPYHNKIQNKLSQLLRATGEYRNIQVEKNSIDIQATSKNNELHYFEIKTNTPKNNIRQAIGQLLEYAFYPTENKAKKLIIVGDEEPSKEVNNYMLHIRTKTKLQIYYRWVDMEKNTLSQEL
ncbi:hypothetical protein [Flavobacterium filum]|uniref:hypothetical protein n=1 Tax=Flavobacterium filum TaxID=370974 RepID=UPI0023F0538C|nr:hypothetical protein [Flavobacterium filum]